jgi:hypothetical protein
MRFLVQRIDTKTGANELTRTDARPTQEALRQRGLATYILRRHDGSVVKKFRVVLNRNGNPKVETETPVGLEGVSTVNLQRMLRAYDRIVKHWPAKAADVRRIDAEITARLLIGGINGDRPSDTESD